MKEECTELLKSVRDGSSIKNADFSQCDLDKIEFGVKEISTCNFSEKEIYKSIFNEVKFLNNDFTGVTFESVLFKGAHFGSNNIFTRLKIIQSKFNNSYFSECNLQGVKISRTDFSEIKFEDCDLRNAFIEKVCLNKATFKRCLLNGVSLNSSDLTDADLTDTDLTDAKLSNADLTRTNLTGANLTEARFSNANLTETNLTNANLSNADMCGAKFNDVIFRNAIMTEVIMSGNQLEKCDFRGAKLTDADFSKVNLYGANLSGANLTGTNLTDADLTGANLTDANLTGAILTRTDMTGTILTGTIFTETGRNEFLKNVGLNFNDMNLEGVKLLPEITNVYTNKVYTNKGFNPITKETENITEWLKDKKNLVFIIDDNKTPMCLDRDSFNFDTIQMNYILYQCDINDNRYVKKTKKIDFNTFLDLSKYNMIEKAVVNFEEFIRSTVKNDQIFLITTKSNLQPIALFNDEVIVNVNMFNKTFTTYSNNILYKNITRHLLTGEKTTSDVMKHIANMDQCFMEYAEVTKDDKTTLYRGMTSPYEIGMGESMIVPNYISTTTSIGKDNKIMTQFMDYSYYQKSKNIEKKPALLPSDVNSCCAYELEIDKDIPFVDMMFSTTRSEEKEILLPRNLLITLIREYITDDGIHIRVLRVSKSTENQFENIHKRKCSTFKQANITAINVKFSNGTGGGKSRRKIQKKKTANTKKSHYLKKRKNLH